MTLTANTHRQQSTSSFSLQAIFSVIIFVLLSSQDGFATKWHVDEHTGIKRAPALYNGLFSTIAFLIGAVSSIVSGFVGMKIATYANARTALEARKGIAAAFAVGKILSSLFVSTLCHLRYAHCTQHPTHLFVQRSALVRLWASPCLASACWCCLSCWSCTGR